MRAHSIHKHLRQRFRHFRFITVITLEDLAVERCFSISGDFEVLNTPCGGHQIAGVGAIPIPSAIGRAFSPGCSNTLLQLFTHDLFDQHLHGAHGKTTQILTKILLARRMAFDDDSGVETSGANVVGFFLGTGIAPSFLENV